MKKIFLLSVVLLLPIFSSSFAETQKKYEFEGRDEDVFCYSTIKDTDKIIELRILNVGDEYIFFDKKQLDRLEVHRKREERKSVYAIQPVENEVVIINPASAGSVYLKFPFVCPYTGSHGETFPLIRADEISKMKLILNRGSLEVILKPKEPKKK